MTAYKSFAEIDAIAPAAWGAFGADGPMEPVPFAYPIADFYLTDPISRASPTMAQCSAVYWEQRHTPAKTGTHG
jgi:NADH-quinone oxidoreductase subunit G